MACAGRLLWGADITLCTGLAKLWALEVIGAGPDIAAGRNLELGNVPSLTAVVDGPDGELYALSQSGPVLRLDAG